MDEREAIRELYRQYWRCMIEKDANGLRGLMAEDYVLMHMTGVRQSGEEFLRGLQNGTFHCYSARHDSIEVTIHGDTAAMTGKPRPGGRLRRGKAHLAAAWRFCPEKRERGLEVHPFPGVDILRMFMSRITT